MSRDGADRNASLGRRRFPLCAVIALLMAAVVILPPAEAQPAPPNGAPPGRWTALDTGTTASLAAVSFSDPLVGHVVGAGGTILATADGGKTWQPQAACTTGKTCEGASSDRITVDLTGVGLWDADRGVAVGADGTIVSTANGGKIWTARFACERTQPCQLGSADRSTADLTAVSVVAPSHAYAVGKAGTILASDDHGRTWRRLPTCGVDTPAGGACAEGPAPKQPADLLAVTATSARGAHAVGAAGTMFVTTDGGKTIYRVGICVEGCDPPIVPVEEQLKDVEQGILRPPFQPPLITTDLAGVAVPRPRHSSIYALGTAGAIFTPAFKGANRWTPQFACTNTDPCVSSSPDRVRADLRALAFPNDLAGYAVGDGGTIVSLTRAPAPPGASADGSGLGALGRWRPDHSATTNDLNAVAFPTPDTGYAVGDAGTVVKRSGAALRVEVKHIQPAQGPTVGRTKVTITGKGFTGATAVYFGRLRASGHTVDSDNQVTATAPAWAAGAVQVSLATPRGPSPGVATARYTYIAPSGGAWEPTASCSPACPGPAVALPSGKVVAAGGADRGPGSAATGVYDPKTRTWTAGAPLAHARTDHTVTALVDGRVLVAGGYTNVSAPGRIPDLSPRLHAEVYDPRAGTWSPAGELSEPRSDHAATLLADGRVLASGGRAGAAQPGAEIWDPGSGAWSPTASMGTARVGHTATRLGDGTVLVVGGCNPTCSGPLNSAEIYDPASQRWRTVAPLKAAHAFHTATVMANGEVLVVGGVAEGEKALAAVERYDPKKGTWTQTSPTHVPRALHSATVMGDGRLLVAGGVTNDPTLDEGGDLTGEPVASAEVYDPDTDRWSLVSEMPSPRALDTAVSLQNACGRECGKVLLAGGTESSEPLLVYKPTRAGTSRAGIVDREVVFFLGAGLVAVLAALVLARRARRR
ncbi:MAG: IPT/TIG domain-containing protein [Actinobacteria bacterium]|nr:IPT/TIG domain-containing protein [Actinomycetota bacterium]